MTGPTRAAPPIANRLELPLGDGLSLRVDFDRAHDRWRHRVLLVVPPGSDLVGPVLLLESIEGTAEDDWPVSPPLQFVSIETRPKKLPVALLMGMSGDGHWSASVEQLPADLTLRFDIACRAKSRPENLGSRYRLGPRVDLQAGDDQAVILQVADYRWKFLGAEEQDAPQPIVHPGDRELQIRFANPVAEAAQTYRWIYCLQAIK